MENLVISDVDYVRLSQLKNNQLLRYEFPQAVIVAAEEVPADVVTMNSTVVFLDESTGTSRKVKLVFPEKVDLTHGKISVLSPLGAALLGLKQGQTIDWPIPSNLDRRLKILQVSKTAYLEDLIMNKAIANSAIFVGAYVVLMALTYYLSNLGSTTLVTQTLDGTGLADSSVSLITLFLHICAMLGILWVSFVRGVMISERWLVLLPIVAFAFDFIPKLSSIPIVPSIYHLLAIVIGVACPIVSTFDHSR